MPTKTQWMTLFVLFLGAYAWGMHYFYSVQFRSRATGGGLPGLTGISGAVGGGTVAEGAAEGPAVPGPLSGTIQPALRDRQRELSEFFRPRHQLPWAEERAFRLQPDIINMRCPRECLGNGLCDTQGVCHCEDGFSGEYCGTAEMPTNQPRSAEFPMPGDVFADRFSCHADLHRETLTETMGIWRSGNFTSDLMTESVHIHPNCVVISVIDNVPYVTRRNKRSKMPDDPTHWHKWRDLFLNLVKTVKLPNVEFPLCLANKPIVEKHDVWPVFGFSSSPVHSDIAIPSGVHRFDFVGQGAPYRLYFLSSDASWDRRQSKAFWRGKASGVQSSIGKIHGYKTNSTSSFPHQTRAHLCLMSRDYPALLDAAFTARDPSHPETDGLVESLMEEDIPLSEQIRKFKYHVVVDGQGLSMRYRAFLEANTVVLKVDNPNKEYFEQWFEPYQHYLPVYRHLGDLMETIDWIRNHDSVARRIAEHAMRHARNVLRLEEVYCFYYHLLSHFRSLMAFEPVMDQGDLRSGRAQLLQDAEFW